MSSTQMSNGHVDMKLEVVVLPVSDVDRAKEFYERLGWRLDADFSGENWRAVKAGAGAPPPPGPRLPGPDPERRSYSSYASFSDPDGNGWVLQEVTMRFPGRGLSMDVATLTELLRDAENAHGKYEASAPKHHWSGWYAAYVVARERGRTPDEAANDAALHMERTRDRVPT